MRYMFLIYSQETPEPAPPEELAKVADAHRAVMTETAQKGVFRGAEPLKPTSTATTVRTRNGSAFTTDGPFAETKEQLAGYYLVEAGTQEEALAIAAKIPGARFGSVEVRPIMTFS